MAEVLGRSERRRRILRLVLGVFAVSGCGGQQGALPTDGSGSGSSPATGVSDAVANEYVTAHNRIRAAVTRPTNYPGTWAALPPVTWSEEVAATAQQWANYLRDANRCKAMLDPANVVLGENGAEGAIGFSATRAVDMWAAEQADYNYAPAYVFEDKTGHYTQVVWRTSTEIGCGLANCATGYLVHVCRYRPAGNVIGSQPY